MENFAEDRRKLGGAGFGGGIRKANDAISR